MSKISNTQLREMLALGLITAEKFQESITLGIASASKRGKLDVLCDNFPEFAEIKTKLDEFRYRTAIIYKMSVLSVFFYYWAVHCYKIL